MKTTLLAITAVLRPCALYATKNMPLTAAEQAAFTPKEVLEALMAGNERYVKGELSAPNVEASN